MPCNNYGNCTPLYYIKSMIVINALTCLKRLKIRKTCRYNLDAKVMNNLSILVAAFNF